MMIEPAAGAAEATLNAALERCHTATLDQTIPQGAALGSAYRGTIGHFPVYFPEEIAHAAGLLPLAVLGGGNRLEMKHADARLGSFVCSICRSTTELGLNGSLASMTGFITHPICDAAKHLAGIWGRNFPDQMAEILYLPQNPNTEGAVEYIASEYQRLRGEFEDRFGAPVTDDALRSSIAVYNANRRLLRELYRIRRDQPWLVTATESYLLTRGRTRMPCEQHTVLLAGALEAIRQRPPLPKDKPRVIFLGGFCEQPPLEMIEAIDDNCYIVDDDLLIGLRWLTRDVAETGDPLVALARAYVEDSAASPVQHDRTKSKEDMLVEMLKGAKADAAILTAAKFCEPGLEDQLAWSKHLEALGIQHLVLEFEEKMTSFEQMAMQVETFAESLLFEFA